MNSNSETQNEARRISLPWMKLYREILKEMLGYASRLASDAKHLADCQSIQLESQSKQLDELRIYILAVKSSERLLQAKVDDSISKDESGAINFAKVERRIPPDFTQENFAVGSYSSAGSAEADRSVFHTLAENLSSQFEKKFPGYRKVSEGVTKAGVYDGYGFRFESVSRNTEKGDITVWGRVIFVPPVDGGKDGVTLLMLTTSLAPELKSVDDVGVKGELPMLLESFRFGKK